MENVLTRAWQLFFVTLSQTDRWFALLRGVVFLGGVGWLLFVPLQPQQWAILAVLLAGFVLYSGGLYVLISLRPARIRTYYLCVFIVDLIIITALNDYVGEVKGSFYLAYYLLVALHAYYFGLGMGLIVAGLASALYMISDYPEFRTIVWPEYALRIVFLFLVATFLGLLAEKDKGDKQHMETLNRELSEKTCKLELAYAQLEDAHRQIIHTEKLSSLGTLVAGVAHEINNPIGIIANRVEVLRLEHEEHGLDDFLREDLEVIHRQANRVAEITTALLTYARQASHQKSLLNLNAVVRSALLLWQPQAEQLVRVDTHLQEPLPSIMGNFTQLQQVVINLLSNALDATPAGGTIAVSTRRAGEPPSSVVLEVADTGSGILAEHLSRVFDPFFTTKPPGKGTGLGLSVCLGIVQDHHGMITVQSQGCCGATFTVTLPVTPREVTPSQVSPQLLQPVLLTSPHEGVS
ncbi:MAG TPA: ATP-binding protein [Candidatus Tectomicrobia bacterium]|nr:ATP-binding protein [Candidatus Tectomicrobia bacterium]